MHPWWHTVWLAIQAEFADIADLREVTQILVRLLMAAVLGAVLGFEREHKGKSAGVRTHMLVCLGAALFVLAPSMAGADEQALSRVVQGIVAGIGFLGAGCIVRPSRGASVHGFTTAAALWSTTGIGIICGLGRWHIAVAAMVLLLIVLAVGGRVEALAHRWLGHDEPRNGLADANADAPAPRERDDK